MQPVALDDLEGLIDKRTILLLRESDIGASYVDFLVRQSPGNISTKNGAQLPLELWYNILAYTFEPEPKYCLVQLKDPRAAKGRMRPSILCQKVEKAMCSPWGSMERSASPRFYDEYIQTPRKRKSLLEKCSLRPPLRSMFSFIQHRNSPKGEYRLEEMKGRRFGIRIALCTLRFDIKVLFTDVVVPDIIALMEGGTCYYCRRCRWVCPLLETVKRAHYELFYPELHHNRLHRATGVPCAATMPCPLCIGTVDYLKNRNYIVTQPLEFTNQNFPNRPMLWLHLRSDEEYEAWQKRFAELGYRYKKRSLPNPASGSA